FLLGWGSPWLLRLSRLGSSPAYVYRNPPPARPMATVETSPVRKIRRSSGCRLRGRLKRLPRAGPTIGTRLPLRRRRPESAIPAQVERRHRAQGYPRDRTRASGPATPYVDTASDSGRSVT